MGKVSKIWVTSESRWYEELKVIAPYREYQYDRMIQSHLKTLFSEYHAVSYNKKITQKGQYQGSKPDFALIRKDYTEWWIVEVETIEDRLVHVYKQIDDFVNGDYNAYQEAQYISKNCDLKFKDIYRATQNNPKVMLIVDDMNSTWIEKFKSIETTNCVLKVYRNNKGLELYSISGDYPYIYQEESHCHFLGSPMTNLLHIVNPDVLNFKDTEGVSFLGVKKGKNKSRFKFFNDFVNWLKKNKSSVTSESEEIIYFVSYKGQRSEWKRIETDGKIYLQPLGPTSTRINDSYILKRVYNRYFILENN